MDQHEQPAPQELEVEALRAAIDEGENSGVVQGNPFDRVRKAIQLKLHLSQRQPLH